MKKLIVLSLSALFLSGCVIGGVSPQQAEEISAKFIEILAPGGQVKIKSVEKAAGGDYKITVEANGQEVISYLSPDGTIFYPQGLNIAELTKQFEEFQKQQAAAGQAVPSPEATAGEAPSEEVAPAEKNTEEAAPENEAGTTGEETAE